MRAVRGVRCDQRPGRGIVVGDAGRCRRPDEPADRRPADRLSHGRVADGVDPDRDRVRGGPGGGRGADGDHVLRGGAERRPGAAPGAAADPDLSRVHDHRPAAVERAHGGGPDQYLVPVVEHVVLGRRGAVGGAGFPAVAAEVEDAAAPPGTVGPGGHPGLHDHDHRAVHGEHPGGTDLVARVQRCLAGVDGAGGDPARRRRLRETDVGSDRRNCRRGRDCRDRGIGQRFRSRVARYRPGPDGDPRGDHPQPALLLPVHGRLDPHRRAVHLDQHRRCGHHRCAAARVHPDRGCARSARLRDHSRVGALPTGS